MINLPTRKNYCALLDKSISDCLQNSFSKFYISDYQIVYCFNTRDSNNLSLDFLDKIYLEVEKEFGKRFIDFKSQKYMLKTGLTVPFSVFPISPENLAELLLQGVFFISFISLDAVEKHITNKGWKFENIIKETYENQLFSTPLYLVVDKNNEDHNFSIPADYLFDCGINFIDLDCLLDNSIYISNNHTGWFSLCYEDEYKIWQ